MDTAISSLSLILVSSFPTLISGIYLFHKLSSKNILTRTSVLNRVFLQLQYTHKKEHSQFINILLYFLLISLLCYYFLPSCVFFIFGIYSIPLFIYLFLATLSLRCCTWDFSSCNKWELLSSSGAQASHCSGFSCCRTQALERYSFRNCDTWAQKLCGRGLAALWHMESMPPDQELNSCPLYWMADSLPLDRQRSPNWFLFKHKGYLAD